MKTILATAYAVQPYKGSEDGMGWNFILQIARFQRVIAITRANNRPHIERYMAAHPDARYARIEWVYHDLPAWQRWWKRGALGAMPYFLLWQRSIPALVRRLHLQFDLAHNLNFHNDWTPSYLWKLGKPFTWGPVGHHPRVPAQYLQDAGWRFRLADALRWGLKRSFWRLSPALRRTRQAAAHIWCMNPYVAKASRIPAGTSSLMPSVASEDPGPPPEREPGRFHVISAGRLLPLKGFDLTIRSFAAFLAGLDTASKAGCQLQIVGSGPEMARYTALVQTLGIAEWVRIDTWMPRTELFDCYRQASAFLFPSHEGAGMVVAEALSFGLPVICLDNAGPGAFIDTESGIAVPLQDYAGTVSALADALTRLHADAGLRMRLQAGARARYATHFHWDRRGEALHTTYQRILS